MARNLRPGPKCIPGIIVGQNDPLSYVVQVEGEHVDEAHRTIMRGG